MLTLNTLNLLGEPGVQGNRSDLDKKILILQTCFDQNIFTKHRSNYRVKKCLKWKAHYYVPLICALQDPYVFPNIASK